VAAGFEPCDRLLSLIARRVTADEVLVAVVVLTHDAPRQLRS